MNAVGTEWVTPVMNAVGTEWVTPGLPRMMIVKLLTEHHLEFLSLKGGRRGSSEATHVKKPHCWKSHALALNFIGH